MNLHEFRNYRDSHALASMLERGRKLETDSANYWQDAQGLRKQVQRNPGKAHLVEEYDAAMRAWAECESEIGNIERDPRYLAWRELQRQTA